MTDMTTTAFGHKKSFLEIEHCDDLSAASLGALTDITGAQDARTLTLVSPRPKCVTMDNDILLVLRGVNMNPNSDPEDMVSQAITDQYYRSARFCDQLDALRERLSLIQEEITAIISDQINQNMYVLSIISLIFLPLGFLTGLFGINVGGMPMLAGGGGALEPIGFWLVVAGCLICAVAIMIIMRVKKWI